jgi:hypothetical protein
MSLKFLEICDKYDLFYDVCRDDGTGYTLFTVHRLCDESKTLSFTFPTIGATDIYGHMIDELMTTKHTKGHLFWS